jgi:uncharacterized membrane protein YfcA
VNLAYRGGVASLMMVIKYAKHTRREVVLRLSPCIMLFIPVGNQILMLNPPSVLGRMLGIFFLAFSTAKILGTNYAKVRNYLNRGSHIGGIKALPSKLVDEPPPTPKCDINYLKNIYLCRDGAMGAMIGTMSGLLGGVYGMSGPPIIIYFSRIAIEKEEIRSTNLVILLNKLE